MSWYRNAVFIAKGLSEFTKSGYEKAKKGFIPNALEVDCTGKVAIVTGANSGLGKEVAQEIAARGGTVYMVCRNKEKAEEARNEIIEKTKNDKLVIKVVDLASLKEIKQFVQEFKAESSRLDILVNNGGCMVNTRTETKDGVETNFATNTLGTFYLTNSLLDVLETSKPSRVVTVSSAGMLTQKLDNSDIETKKGTFDGTFVYAMNKRQQVVLTELWTKKYESKGISFYSCHPGWADTPAVQNSMPEFHARLQGNFRTPPEGADTIVWLAISPEVPKKVKSGDFVQDRMSVSKHLPLAWTHHDVKEEENLWNILNSYIEKLNK